MVSKAFFTGSKYLVEDNDGRRDYLRLDGERFLASLSAAGRKVLSAPFEVEEQQREYLKSLVTLNESYFAAREYEDDAKGSYFKHDEHAERQFRFETAERLSDCVADLRTLLAAHDDLVAAAAEQVECETTAQTEGETLDQTQYEKTAQTKGERAAQTEGEASDQIERGPDTDANEPNETLSAVRSTLLACTNRAVSEAWFPVVEAYYYSLSPGELVAEDRERRNQRIEGTESSRGLKDLLDLPHFEKLTERDLRRIRELNRTSPGSDPRVWKRLLHEYPWYVSKTRGESLTEKPSDAES
jgi:hypothetical protein